MPCRCYNEVAIESGKGYTALHLSVKTKSARSSIIRTHRIQNEHGIVTTDLILAELAP